MDYYTRRVLENKAYCYITYGITDVSITNACYKEIEKMPDDELIAIVKEYKSQGKPLDYDTLALLRAELIGVYAYKVKGNKMIYISYFGSEGFYKVTHNLDSGEETRKHQNATKLEYNYFCG